MVQGSHAIQEGRKRGRWSPVMGIWLVGLLSSCTQIPFMFSDELKEELQQTRVQKKASQEQPDPPGDPNDVDPYASTNGWDDTGPHAKSTSTRRAASSCRSRSSGGCQISLSSPGLGAPSMSTPNLSNPTMTAPSPGSPSWSDPGLNPPSVKSPNLATPPLKSPSNCGSGCN